MDEPKVIFVANESKFDLPEYKTIGAAGMDIRANINYPVTLKPGERRLIKTGLKAHIPVGYEIQIRSRSGLALKHGIIVLNAPGTIDSDYRGEIGVILMNTSNKDSFELYPGDRIAQMVLCKVARIEWFRVDNLGASTERGDSGFGSTGTK